MKKSKDITSKTRTSLKMLIVFLIIIIALILASARLLKEQYILQMYPRNILSTEVLSIQVMEHERFNSLADISNELSGQGITIYATKKEQVFDYTSNVYARLRCDRGSGVIVIARGTGHIQSDVEAYVTEYFDFLGDVTGIYKETVYEKGYSNNGYAAEYSAGKLDITNLFKREGFYIIALEYELWPDEKAVFIYASDTYRDLKSVINVLEALQQAAVRGGADTTPDIELPTPKEEPNGISSNSPDFEKTQDKVIFSAGSGYISQTVPETSPDVLFNEEGMSWAEEYAASGGLSTEGEPVRIVNGNVTTMECTADVNRDYEKVMFVYQSLDGNPIHAILFSPDFGKYYEPIRYDANDGKYYFYVEEPEQGLWRGVLELRNCNSYGVLNYYQVSDEEALILSQSVSEYEASDAEEAEGVPQGDGGLDIPLNE